MTLLNLADNIVRLRREQKITQEELADFIGVTKASVSKWENRQSMPDILLLPQLASFFGVTVDELIGYEAQLSQEQIRRYYVELTGDFVKLPYHEVVAKVRSLVHRYYSCYPFLLQMCVLYLNHVTLAPDREESIRMVKEAIGLSERILDRCSDVGVCGDAMAISAVLNLYLGKSREVIEILEPVASPERISSQNGTMLIQAYQMAGDTDKARSYAQVQMYIHVLSLTSTAILHLSLYENDEERCRETIRRIEGLISLFRLQKLHPNVTAQFYYQEAVIYAGRGNHEEALEALEKFGQCIGELMGGEQPLLHGDSYFDCLDAWISQLPLGPFAPRDKSFIGESVMQGLAHPAFNGMRETDVFKNIYSRLAERGNCHDGN